MSASTTPTAVAEKPRRSLPPPLHIARGIAFMVLLLLAGFAVSLVVVVLSPLLLIFDRQWRIPHQCVPRVAG